jgi:hypothetical protein
MASSTCLSSQLLARVGDPNKTHACYKSQLRLAAFFTAILNHLAQQALMHACAVDIACNAQMAPMADGAGTAASTLFSSHLPQVDCARHVARVTMAFCILSLIVTICEPPSANMPRAATCWRTSRGYCPVSCSARLPSERVPGRGQMVPLASSQGDTARAGAASRAATS